MFAFTVEHFFAGLWSLVWHFGVGIGLVVLLCVAAYFIPIGRKWFIGAAIVVLAFVFGEGVGVNLEKKHNLAQAATVTHFVKKVVKGTTTVKSRKAKDPWNSKRN